MSRQERLDRLSFEIRARKAVEVASNDAIKHYIGYLFGSHDKLLSIEALLQNYEFHQKIPDIERAALQAQTLAEPEAHALQRRLMFVNQRRKTILQKAQEISREPPRERVRQWGSLTVNLLDLSPEIHLLPVDAEACTLFVGQLHTPEDRYPELRSMAHEKLSLMKLIPLEDALRRQWRFLQHVEKGLFRPTDVTLFDILLASERISQERMKIESYATPKGNM